MALSDLAVFSEYAYTSFTEVLQQQIDLFNGATAGALILRGAAHQGDFSDTAFYAKIAGGVVRRRNAYGTGAIAQKTLQHLVDTSVKVAAGTPELVYDHSQFTWIQRNPEEAGVVLGQQLAVDSLADMLNVAIGSTYAALVQETEVVYDATGNSGTGETTNASWKNLLRGTAKFGDMSNRIQAWITHSAPMFQLYENNLDNMESLFTYGTVNVQRDPFGRIIVVSDAPALVTAGAGSDPNEYHILGLKPGACYIGVNNDWFANETAENGNENIQVSYQAEWTYNVGIDGFAWDKTSGGKSPTDAALFTSANWDRTATSHKDLAGVVVEVDDATA